VGHYAVQPGELGENITTRGIDLLGLPTGALLHIGGQAVVEVAGLRNPSCPSPRTAGSNAFSRPDNRRTYLRSPARCR
jgi:MOSC domain-containing protein YiiM